MPFRTEQLIVIGVAIIIVGFITVFIGSFMSSKDANSRTKVAVGGFIGFIPFGFGNDKNFVWFITILSLALILFWIFFSSDLQSKA